MVHGENRNALWSWPRPNVRSFRPAEKRFQELGIELSVRGPHFLRGPRVRHAVAIRPRGSKRVVHIRHAQDSGGERDLVPGQSVRITGAVPALVMIPDDGPHVPGKIDIRHELEASL